MDKISMPTTMNRSENIPPQDWPLWKKKHRRSWFHELQAYRCFAETLLLARLQELGLIEVTDDVIAFIKGPEGELIHLFLGGEIFEFTPNPLQVANINDLRRDHAEVIFLEYSYVSRHYGPDNYRWYRGNVRSRLITHTFVMNSIHNKSNPEDPYFRIRRHTRPEPKATTTA